MKSLQLVTVLIATATLWAGIHATAAEPAPAPADGTDVSDSTLWATIKDYSFDQRVDFLAGLARLEARLDAQINELTARRATFKADANTKDWDFAMKEVHNARAYLKGTGEVLAKSVPETWAEEKERVSQAWVRAQAACAKVKASTTT